MPLADLFSPTFPSDVFQITGGSIVFHHFEPRRGGGVSLTAARETPLVPEAWHDQPIGRSAAGAASVREAVDAARRLAGGVLRRAALVVDDSWCRVFLLDFERTPGSDRETDDMVVWKLRKLLPFRPEELRFVWSRPGSAAGSTTRYLVIGMLERVAASLESAFEANGVRIGLIEPASFAASEIALGAGPSDMALLQAGEDSFQLLIFRGGSAVLYRTKRAPADLAARGDLLARELDLTRAFVVQEAPFPTKVHVVEEPGSGWNAAEVAARVLGEGSDVRTMELPSFVSVPADFPAPLAGRTLRAAGAVVPRSL